MLFLSQPMLGIMLHPPVFLNSYCVLCLEGGGHFWHGSDIFSLKRLLFIASIGNTLGRSKANKPPHWLIYSKFLSAFLSGCNSLITFCVIKNVLRDESNGQKLVSMSLLILKRENMNNMNNTYLITAMGKQMNKVMICKMKPEERV